MSAQLQLVAEPLDLRYEHPFTTARDTQRLAHNVVVTASGGGVQGRGEGAPRARWSESQSEALEALRGLAPLAAPRDLDEAAEIVAALERRGVSRSALAALDCALHDWFGRSSGCPLAELWQLTCGTTPPTSLTIGIDGPESVAARVRQSAGFSRLKLKLGGAEASDIALVRAARAASDVPLRVDANEGWRDRDRAARLLDQLAPYDIELVEQPLPANRLEDVAWLRARSSLELIADEDCVAGCDLGALAEVYSGVNIKLDKCGGLAAARAMASGARARGLRVMVGCMGSSSLAITAAAHLAVEADLVDLDGHLLIAADPYRGATLTPRCALELPRGPGLGVTSRYL